MLGESLDGLEVVVDRVLGVVAPLEFLQHRASEMGHKTPPVTRTLPGRSSAPHAERPPRQRLGPNADLSTRESLTVLLGQRH